MKSAGLIETLLAETLLRRTNMSAVKEIIGNQLIKSLDTSATVIDAVNLMSLNKISCVLIEEKGLLKGIFTDSDLKERVIAKGLDYKKTPLSQVMTHPVETIDMDRDLQESIREMKQAKCSHLPVMDKSQVVAVLSKNKVLKFLLAAFKRERDHLMDYITR